MIEIVKRLGWSYVSTVAAEVFFSYIITFFVYVFFVTISEVYLFFLFCLAYMLSYIISLLLCLGLALLVPRCFMDSLSSFHNKVWSRLDGE